MFSWFNAKEAKEAGVTLADFFSAKFPNNKKSLLKQGRDLQQLLNKAEQIKRTTKLNIYKKAQLGNAFKWRLLELGYEQDLIDELTREILLALN